MRDTRPASLATIVIALGLALTTIGINRGLPYQFGGIGDRTNVVGDVWAHGSAVSPPLVLLVALGLLAAIAARPGAGGRRAASWLAVLGSVGIVAAAMEPVQQRILQLRDLDPALSPLIFAAQFCLVLLVAAAIVRVRADRPPADQASRSAGQVALEPA